MVRLDEAEQKLSATLRVRMVERDINRDRLVALRSLLRANPGDCAVVVHVLIPGESETTIAVGGIRGVQPSLAVCRDVDALFGRKVTELCL